MKKLNIGIVGGSIAGCSAGIMLRRARHTVSIFERSRGGLVGRGGGIGTPGAVFRTLIEADIIDEDFPHLTGTNMPFIIRTAMHEKWGYSPWGMPIDLKAFHWTALWNNLRKRIPDDSYHQGVSATGAKHDSAGGVTLEFGDGSTQKFDLVIFADGYQSLGRRLLFPDVALKYRGYMLWRGLLPEEKVSDSYPLGTNVPRLSYSGLPGNFVAYFVPSQEGSAEKDRRIVNWAAYIPLPESELAEFMVDRDGVVQTGTIPPGRLKPETETNLKQIMAENLPVYYGDMVTKTENTYVQLIYTVSIPAYHSGCICLIGDAGMVAQPFTGSGVFKGYHNIKDLLQALENDTYLDKALDEWSRAQVQIGNRLLILGEQMEQAFIWNSLDLANADSVTTSAWWKKAVTFPDEFTYAAEEN